MKKSSLTYEMIISTLIKQFQRNNVTLVLNDPQIGEDNGFAYDGDEIHLGTKYSSNWIMLAIAMHEYGHLMVYRRKGKKYRKLSIFAEESLAWVLGQEYQMRWFGRSFTKSQGNFMLECLHTYSKQHYNFTKGYNNVHDNDDEDEA